MITCSLFNAQFIKHINILNNFKSFVALKMGCIFSLKIKIFHITVKLL